MQKYRREQKPHHYVIKTNPAYQSQNHKQAGMLSQIHIPTIILTVISRMQVNGTLLTGRNRKMAVHIPHFIPFPIWRRIVVIGGIAMLPIRILVNVIIQIRSYLTSIPLRFLTKPLSTLLHTPRPFQLNTHGHAKIHDSYHQKQK